MKNLTVLFSLFILLLGACGKKPEVFHASIKPITASVYASGVVKGKNQYQVFPKTIGTIEAIFVSEGDLVKAGQPILKISNAVAELSKKNADATARFNDLKANQDKLQELVENINLLRDTYTQDSLLWMRQQVLFKEQVGSQLELEQRTLNFKRSKANYQTSLLKYQQLKRQVDYAALQSKVSAGISEVQLEDLVVKSDIHGKVFSILKKRGEMVNTQSPVAIVASAELFYLELLVDEFDIAKIKIGQQVVVTMDSYKGQVFEAKVSKIVPIMNERNKTFLIEADFNKAPEKLYPNLTAEANIVIQSKEQALLIPRNLLVDQQYVLLANGERRLVQTGLADYEQVEILSGITTADELLIP
jgi:HlyD family secretion protein